jgi:hypothetical protein
MSTVALTATGRIHSDEGRVFRGSCFAFRDPNVLLTAKHCVADTDVADLNVIQVFLPSLQLREVLEVVPHPTADLALLRCKDYGATEFAPFSDAVATSALGEEFMAYGHPEDTTADGPQPTPRLFRGYFQRFMRHRSFNGSDYLAAELSIPCPDGLSGSALFRPGTSLVTAMATENREHSQASDLETVEEHFPDGRHRVTVFRRTISYGVALMLASALDWLDDHVQTAG